MRTLLTILFCSLLTAVGQIPPMVMQDMLVASQGNVAGGEAGWIDTYYPTNIAGFPANGWWVGDNAKSSTSTNAVGLVTNWLDWSGNGYNLTNLVANSEPTISNNCLNAHSVLSFDGSNDLLRNVPFTNTQASTGSEFVMVVLFKWADASLHYIFRDNVGYALSRLPTTGYYGCFGNSPTVGPSVTNTWLVLAARTLANAYTYIYTNSVLVTGGPCGDANLSSLGVGGRYSDGAASTPMLLAEFVSYNTNLTAEIRSNLFAYFTNKYGAMP
jgi:hypothetical protein